MSEKIVQFNEEIIKGQLKELVRGSVEETLNELLEKEAESLTQAAGYERSEARQGYRGGHYDRNLTTSSFSLSVSPCASSVLHSVRSSVRAAPMAALRASGSAASSTVFHEPDRPDRRQRASIP